MARETGPSGVPSSEVKNSPISASLFLNILDKNAILGTLDIILAFKATKLKGLEGNRGFSAFFDTDYHFTCLVM